MVTFYQCYQEYLQKGNVPGFSKKTRMNICFRLAEIYDSRVTNPPIEYTESIEGLNTYKVRNYPDSFKPTIVGIINKVSKKVIANIESKKFASVIIIDKAPDIENVLIAESALAPIYETVNNMIVSEETVKYIRRKRKHVIKPEFSAKPLNKKPA